MITKAEVKSLEVQYQKALDALPRVNYIAGYPDYPKEVSEFMGALTSPPWGLSNYRPGEIAQVMEKINEADIDEIRCVLTGVSRSERFGDGSWANILEKNLLEKVFQRLRQIVNA